MAYGIRLIGGLASSIMLTTGGPASGEELRILVIGDNLSEEYASLSGGWLYPVYTFATPDSKPTEVSSINWVEALAQWRGESSGPDHAAFGYNMQILSGSGWEDLRWSGYGTNFGLPRYKIATWVLLMTAPKPDGSNGGYQPGDDPVYDTQQNCLSAFATSDVVVIMLGAMDIEWRYQQILDGREPGLIYTQMINGLMYLARRFDGVLGTRPVVICTVPDLGVAPALAALCDDPAERASARAKIQAMNDELKAQASAAGYGIADLHALTLRLEDEDPFLINGQQFIVGADPENPPEYLFCKDGFHPGTVLQMLMSNEVVGAINELVGSSIAPYSDREILDLVPGLDPDRPFLDWIGGQGVAEQGMHDNPDGDAFDNLAEFAFGLAAGRPDSGLDHDWSGPAAGRFGILWSLAPAAAGYVEVGAETSGDLEQWMPLDPSALEDLGGGAWRASIPAGDRMAFLRATVDLAP